jgi:pimeloyl-ACP methyl ester carboxylesterase
MATVVKMPKWGLTMTAGTVTDWFYAEGAEVSAGDPIFTVETEKAVNDVEAPADGVLVKIVAAQGDEVPVSGPVAVIASPGEQISDDDLAALVAAASPAKARTGDAAGPGAPTRTARAASRDDSGRVNASPAARRRAQELGIELAEVEATGPDGRVTSDDVERYAATLSADPTPREERIRLADGRELNALVAGAGDGPALVFLHGLGGALSTWQVVLGDLVEGHRIAAIDLPGHGLSDKSAEADYSVSGLASALAEAMEQLGIEKPVLVGHSLGAAIALSIAANAPDRVSGVVAIDAAGLGTEISAELTALMSGPAGTETARGLLRIFYEDQRLVADRAVQDMAQMQTAEGAWPAHQAVAIAAFAGDRQLPAARVDSSGISVPVYLIWGERDRVLPVGHAIAALSAFPDASLTVLPGIGHVPQVEAAARTARLIARFAKSVS